MKDKVVIITGASSGIGEALAYELGRRGARLVLAARTEERLNEVAAKIPGALAVPTDVTDEAACKALIEQAAAQFGRIDVLVNNAGVSQWAYFEEISDLSLFRRLMEVNYLSAVYCTHYALPYLKQTRGLFVAVSSIVGRTGVPTRTGYAASKHAMEGFFKSLRIELRGSGVDVLIVSPGYVQSQVRINALGSDGQARGVSHLDESAVMTAEDCARQITEAMIKRKRDLLFGWRAKVGLWLQLIAPGLVDRMALNAIRSGRS